MSFNNIQLGLKLREIRKNKSMLQTDVATLLGLNVKTIQRYEKGLNLPANIIDIYNHYLKLSNSELIELRALTIKDDINQIDLDNEPLKVLFNTYGFIFDKINIDGSTLNIVKNKTTNNYYILDKIDFINKYQDIIKKLLIAMLDNELILIDDKSKNDIETNINKYLEYMKKD